MSTEFWGVWIAIGIWASIRDYKYLFDDNKEFLGMWIGAILWIYLAAGPIMCLITTIMIFNYERSPEGRKNRFQKKMFFKNKDNDTQTLNDRERR